MHHPEFSLPNFGQQDCENFLREHFSGIKKKGECRFILFGGKKEDAVFKQEKPGKFRVLNFDMASGNFYGGLPRISQINQ
jgi:hypothetical protein